MGKPKKGSRSRKSQFDDFFEKNTVSGGHWLTGSSSMLLDEGAPVTMQQCELQGLEITPAPSQPSQPRKLGLTKATLKVSGKRGNKTATQARRKAKAVEKALARTEKISTKVTCQLSKQKKKGALKHIY